MKKVLVALVTAVAVVFSGLAVVSPAQAAPKKQCIYMVKDVGKYSSFLYIVWKKKGKKIVGHAGGFPGPYEQHWLTYQARKDRAVGIQEDPISGDFNRYIYRTVGKGKTLRVKGYKRISKARMAQLTPGSRGGVPGCKA